MEIATRRHPLFADNIDLWEFYLESFKGGHSYVEKYLKTHRLEAEEDFLNRRQRGYYLNYCAPICSIPADFIFKKEATRPADENLSAFRNNVDGRGNNIHEFMRKVCILSNIYGHIHILMDTPKLNDGLKNKAEKGKLTKRDTKGILPYLIIVHPQALLDWSLNPDTRELEWVLIKEEVYEDIDFTKDREEQTQYKVWTKEEWIIFDDKGQEAERGAHNLGVVPLVTNYHKDIDLDMVGEGMLKDVAEANRVILNWSSNIDEMIARQTFSQLICPDDGELLTEEIDENGKSKALRRVGASSIFTFPADASHAPKFISPDTQQVETIWDMISNHVKEMFRMSGLISAKTSLIQLQQRTGKAQEFEFLDMAVFFAAKAKKLEMTEDSINLLYYRWTNVSKDLPEPVHYPDKFDISTPTEVVDLFTKVILNNISPRLHKEMAKRLVFQVLPHAEDAVIEQINDEIESNTYLEDTSPVEGGKEDGEKPSKEVQPKKDLQKTEVVPNAKNKDRVSKWRNPKKDKGTKSRK